ncbi:MAG: sensor histidine kinase [Rhodobacter sp.]|nr:sensor histidine kinase [Rhodobacter sp.]
MRRALSLRVRLTLIVLLPLLAIAFATGLWQLDTARRTAADVFDRSLLSAALAVSNDVAISGGDALSPRTEQILSDTSGGRVFYHVYAPDGVIVAGYATPPVGIPRAATVETGPTYFQATYLGREVSGVRLQTQTEIDDFSGVFTTTVWQDTAVRSAFMRDLVLRSLIAICGLIVSVALVVWFGIRLGLRPLIDLQQAIERRSSDELSPIRRPVPEEVTGIVETLNSLFAQVSRSMSAQAEFISNAAHQLRNPIAGVLALAEAVHAAPTQAQARARSADLLGAARDTADLTQRLLMLERAKATSPASQFETVDLAHSLGIWVAPGRRAAGPGVTVDLEVAADVGTLTCDPTMLREAVSNLIDNALTHGGPGLARVCVAAERAGTAVEISISDDGRGIAEPDIPAAVARFSQLSPGAGSGLGLAIADAVAAAHGGAMRVEPLNPGVRVTLSLPLRGGPSAS